LLNNAAEAVKGCTSGVGLKARRGNATDCEAETAAKEVSCIKACQADEKDPNKKDAA